VDGLAVADLPAGEQVRVATAAYRPWFKAEHAAEA
jgi:hypothetical protein